MDEYDLGHEDGYESGYSLGFDEGWEAGREVGYEEGLHDGRSEPRGSAVDEREWLERVNDALYRYDMGILDVRDVASDLEAYR